MQNSNIYIFILLILGLTSCEKIVKDVDAPNVKQQLVLYGFISPEDSSTQIELTLSEPIFDGIDNDGSITFLSGANVVIEDGAGNKATLVFDNAVYKYVVSASSFPVIPGRTYYITATAEGKTVKASCTVPLEKVELTGAKYQRLGEPSTSYTGPYLRFSYEWIDVPGKSNYYMVSTMNSFTYAPDLQDTDYTSICEGMAWSDYKNDGEIIKGLCEDYNYGGGSSLDVAFFLLHTDIHYYEYHRRRMSYDEGNPFSEPYEQYSNVEGGLGVFCSFRRSKRVLTVAP